MVGDRGHTFLLELNIADNSLVVRSYQDALLATEAYGALERATEDEPREGRCARFG
jgi:hypothetical protein